MLGEQNLFWSVQGRGKGNGWGKLLLGALSRGACRPLGQNRFSRALGPLAEWISASLTWLYPSCLNGDVELPGSPQLQGTGTEREAQPCPPAAFPPPEPCCHLERGKGALQLAPSAWPALPRFAGSRHHRLLPPPAAPTLRLNPWGIAAAAPGIHPGRQRAARRRWRRPRRCTILALKQTKKTKHTHTKKKTNSKRRTDLRNDRLALQLAGTQSRPGSSGEEMLARGQITNCPPQHCWGPGLGRPCSHPSYFGRTTRTVLSWYHLCPRPPAPRIVTVLACTVLMYQKTL